MSPIKQEYNSSVERHMLANQKVWGSIPSQGMPFLFCSLQIYTSFTPKLQGKTRHGRYTRNVANRILSLKQVYNTCFSFFELMFWILPTRDKHNLLHVKTQD